jgi:general secretion pathway protein L
VSSDGGRWAVTGTRLRASTGKHKAAGLLVPEPSCLWGTVQLPEMPRQSLDSAVQETLWRVSPLPPEHIVAAWQAVPASGGGWTIEWGMCRRSDQEALLAQHGLAADAPVYLALLLLLGAMAVPALMPLILKRQAVVRAVEHVGMLEPKAAPLRQQLDELRQQSLLADELRQSIGTDLPLASVVDRLSETLPDDAWLDRIEINGSEIRIMGLTGNATELIAHLGRQPALAEARATVASVRDNTLNKERFTFEMRWRGEGAKP